ncbi:MAG: hypothetical protein J2P51_12050, partial [Hyphomicrobiaceae bacterium]|nr:hypothetical protein [Hyphomicrobiaceae bacterium]
MLPPLERALARPVCAPASTNLPWLSSATDYLLLPGGCDPFAAERRCTGRGVALHIAPYGRDAMISSLRPRGP